MAFELMRKGKKYAKAQPETVDYTKEDAQQEAAEARASPAVVSNVKVKAEEFGGAAVYRRYCDNPTCKGPITVCWKGRRGEYCSNNCLKTEKENNMTTEETSPIAAGAPATKKGKAAKKAAPAKKAAATKKAAAPKAAAAESDRAIENAKVITLVKSDKLPEYRGVKADITKQIKDGITVGQYKANVASKVPGKHSWDAKNVLEAAAEAGAIKIK